MSTARILLVDDRPQNLLALEAALAPLQQQIVCANSGFEAIEKAKAIEFAVVVLDVMMPRMDGFETAHRLKDISPHLPILFVTAAHDAPDLLKNAYGLGAVDYIPKPIDPYILLAKVSVFVELYQRGEALRVEASERARKQAALEHAQTVNKLKDEFLAVVSHELRTPLAAILGWTTILRSGKEISRDKLARAVEVIERSARSQVRIVDDILDIARVSHGTLYMQCAAVDVDVTARQALELVKPTADIQGVKLHYRHAAERSEVIGDQERMRQIIGNLLDNAVKFTPKGGNVWLSVSAHETQVVITVRDDGAGIRPEVLPTIFERFRQGDSFMTRTHGGLGLGLALVRHLVELHSGSVRAASAGDNQGATFTVTLPRRASLATSPTGSPARASELPSAASGNALSGIRVLFAEDDQDSRETTELLLKGSGADVVSAASADGALSLLDAFKPDVLLTDLAMPEKDGYWLLQHARSKRADLPAIALTAHARDEDAERARQAGFDCHLAKPVRHELLVEKLAKVTKERARA